MSQIKKLKKDRIFVSGDLVKIAVEGLKLSEDGFSMGGMTQDPDTIVLYESISLRTYPSSRDFFGKRICVSEDEKGIIIKHIGRPERISRDPAWFKYDVYEILIKGSVFQVFAQNIRKY